MVNSNNLAIQNNFIAGLKTQFTGLNFPENAAIDSQNAIYTLIGDVTRRGGMDYELNYTTNAVSRTGNAVSSYKWNNVGGDGQTQIVVVQIGSNLYFYLATNATISSPLSTTLLASTLSLTPFAINSADPSATSCQFADGNGYLFVFHPQCDPFYVYFIEGTPNTVAASVINVKIRDFNGVYPEPGNPAITFRPTSLTSEHKYNLLNQGWTDASGWSTNSSDQSHVTISGGSVYITPGNNTFTVTSGLTINVGDPVSLAVSLTVSWTNGGVGYSAGIDLNGNGVVISYSGSSLVVNVNSFNPVTEYGTVTGVSGMSWSLSEDSSVTNTVGTWNGAIGNYPSNADIWFQFKNSSGVFAPGTTIGNIALPTAPAARGHFILSAFNQNKAATSGVSGITSISTSKRPRTGCWFQGRIWYTGVDDSQVASGDEPFYTWTENIYFSQIIVNINEAGYCYQENDPTDENLFDILSTDGGVITIQGSGAIYRLFPVQNGVIVFAANGIWFITGSTGIGFSATDYTITKISGIQSISSTSYINVMGYPIFWNEEGIYSVTPGQNGILQVENLTVDTILNFFSNIPLQSKKYARGDYNPITFQVQWVYRSTNETSVTDRYQYDSILIFNVKNKAFYYYTIGNSNTAPWIHDIRYVAGPGGSTSPMPTMKYLTSVFKQAQQVGTMNQLISATYPMPTYVNQKTVADQIASDTYINESVEQVGNYNFTFSEERDFTNYVDWHTSGASINFISYFVAGYNLHGKAYSKWQPIYIYVYSKSAVDTAYKVRGRWNYAISGNSGKWSTVQVITNTGFSSNFGNVFRRHKIRGHGHSFQLNIQSVDGKPFDILGWSMFESINSNL